MRIIFLSYNYSPDIHSPGQWVERIKYYVGWLEWLAKEHTVIRIDQINYTGSFENNGVLYHCMNAGGKKNYFPRKLNDFVKKQEPDIVVISSFLFPLQVIQLRYHLGKKVKLIVQHHAEKPFTGIKKWLQKISGRKINAGIFASHSIYNEWIQKGNLPGGLRLLEVIDGSSGFDPVSKTIARQKINITASPVFLWVGRLNQNKDPLTTVKAFLRFAAFQPSAKLYMIYQETELLDETRTLLSSTNQSAVILIGKISHEELLYWFSAADFFISASHYEGGGIALCEAMSCGCIPIVTNIPSFRMASNGFGILYEPGNIDELYSALQQSVNMDIEKESTQIKNHFKKELSFEAIAAKFNQLISSL